MQVAPLTPAQARQKIALHRLLIYRLAARIDVHPSRLSLMLNERIPLPADVAERLRRAIEIEAGSCSSPNARQR